MQKIQQYTAGMSYSEFAADPKTQDAVIRNFITIGEAANHVPDDIAQRYPAIPWGDMRDMRNVVVHQYFGVSLRTIWETVQSELPPLVESLQRILET